MEGLDVQIAAVAFTVLIGIVSYLLNKFINRFEDRMKVLSDSISELAKETHKSNLMLTKQGEIIEALEEKTEVINNRINGYSVRLNAIEKIVVVIDAQHKQNHK